MTLPPIYVISLARAEKRRESISSRLNAANVQFEITDAVDGESLDISTIAHRLNRKKFRKTHDYEMMPGEIGCFLSHYNLWERMVTEKTPYALILEDDATWDEDSFQVVSDLVESKYYWNLVHLAVSTEKRTIWETLDTVGNNRQLVCFRKPKVVTAAYLIDLDGAKKLLKHCYEISNSIDRQFNQYWECDLYFYHVQPAPIQHDEDNSLIEYHRKIKKVKPKLQRAKDLLWRTINSYHKRIAIKKHLATHPPKLRN